MNEYIIKEYEISKDSIKSVMTQLIAVSASLITVTIVMLKLIFDDEKNVGQDPLLRYLVILMVNFLVAFTAYQNIQIVALQKHIKSLEKKLEKYEVFRWESKIARVWYSDTPVAVTFNALLVAPPLSILILLYYELSTTIGLDIQFYLTVIINIAYFALIGICFSKLVKKLDIVIN